MKNRLTMALRSARTMAVASEQTGRHAVARGAPTTPGFLGRAGGMPNTRPAVFLNEPTRRSTQCEKITPLAGDSALS
jgi:hypothetical protein